MATKNRDVELGITVTTAGSEGIRNLKAEVDALAKGGGDAAPQFRALSDELDRLGAQAQALEAFSEVSREIDALSLAQSSAAAAANKLSLELAEAVAKADGFRNAQAQVTTELQKDQAALTEARIALAAYKNENKDAIGTTDAYKQRVQQLTTDIIILRREIADKSVALRDAKKATNEAEVEEGKLEAAYTRSTKQAQQATTALYERESAQRKSLNTLEALGLETQNLTASEIGLVNALVLAQAETQQLAQAQRDAAAAAERQAQEAQALAQAEKQAAQSYSQWWAQALYEREQAENKTRAAQKAAADEAERSGQAIRDALGTVGLRSATELRAEIDKVKQSLTLLKNSGTLVGAELDQAMAVGQRRISELERQIREATGQMTLMDKVSKGLNTTFAQFAGAITLVEVVQRLARGFFDATKQIETLRLALGQVYGSTQVAAQQIDFLRATATRAGVSVGAISDSFVKFSASTKSANIPLEQTNALFAAVTRSAGTLGLSGDKVTHILDALSQMAAKGVVSMEELRQQLGDSLPGAMSLAAKGLGLTDAELIKLVESGGLLARDVFPALTSSLQSMQGEVNTFSAAWERTKNALTLTFQAIGDAGVLVVLKQALAGAKAALDFFGLGLVTVLESLRLAFEGTGTFIGVLVGSGSLTEALNASAEKAKESADRLVKYRNAMFDGRSEAEKMAAQTLTVNKGTEAQQLALTNAAKAIQEHTAATVSQGVATEAAAQKAALSGKNWQQLSIGLEELRVKSESQVLVSEKLSKAKEQEGKNTAELAKLTGDETAARAANINAAQGTAAALETVAAVRERTLAQQVAYRDALIDEAQRLGDADGARQKSIEKINQRIDTLAAETDRARQSADEAKNHALQLQIEADAMQNNSGRVAELDAARQQARANLEEMVSAEKQGLVTHEQVKLKLEELTRAEALYRDALQDRVEVMKANQGLQKAEQDLVQAGLQIRLEQLRGLERLAVANKDENLATYAKVEAKRTEIKIIESKVAIMKIEAEGAIAVSKATLAELEASGKLTDVKRIEIQTAIKLAEVKLKQSDATKETIKALEAEIGALQSGTSARRAETSGRNENIAAINGETSAIERKISALEKEQQLQARADAQKWGRDAAGNIVNGGGDLGTRTGIFNYAKSAGADEENARRIANEFADSQGNVPYMNNVGMTRYGQFGDTISMAVMRAVEKVTFSGGGSTPTTAQQPSNAGGSRTININLGGTSTKVNVASDADATNLESVLKQLAAAKGSSI